LSHFPFIADFIIIIIIITMVRFTFTALVVSIVYVGQTVSAFQNGDTCGVTSRDFMNYDYLSDYMVAGAAGCTLGDETGCYCAPNLQDEENLGMWDWQCNNDSNINVVNFGPNPSTGKVCPATVPVAKGLGELEFVMKMNRALQSDASSEKDTSTTPAVVGIGTESQLQKMSVSCNTTVHPTGQPGDEVCPYSDCDEGGDHSAICACLDLSKYGMGEGEEWVCMHATCNCEDKSATNDIMDDGQGQQENLNEDLNESSNEVSNEDSNVSAASVISTVLSFSMLAMVVILN
jgi:hypothetical protein